MTWAFLLALLFSQLASEQPAAPRAEDLIAKLRWQNSEVLSGELREASSTELSWHSPLFGEPLRLRWDAIRRIDQMTPATAAPESFGVALRDGSHLLGDLAGIDAESVTMQSARHGEVRLRRAEVLRIYRARGGKIIVAGPSGDVGWTLDEGPRIANQPVAAPTIPQMVTGPGGALSMPYWNTKARWWGATPDRVEIEIDLRFAAAPAFRFRFDGEGITGVRIENWDDELVVALGDEFHFIRKIDEKERELSLRICWDRTAKKGALFNAAGEPLAEWTFTAELKKNVGCSLQNKGRELTLTRFLVREWDGAPPAKRDATKPRVELADGRVLEGSVVEAAADVLKMADAPSSHPLAEVAEIVFANDAAKPAADSPAFAFADSTLCHGRLLSIAGGRAAVETTFASAPVSVSMASLRQVRLSKSPRPGPGAPLDEILLDSTKLHGTLTASGDGRLHWLPVGGVHSAVPHPATSLKVTRAVPPEAAAPAAPALFYTSFGDIIPATLRGLNGAVVEIESEVVETKTLNASSLDAVQFGDVTQASVRGFDAPGWHIVKGDERSVHVSKDRLEIEQGGAFAHPLVLQSDEFRFSFDPEECGTFRLRLFSGGANAERTTNFVIAPNGGNVYVSVEDKNGEQGFNNTQAEPGKPVAVRVEIKDASINLYIGERVVRQAVSDPKRRVGSGLVIEPATLFENAVSDVKLTGFSTTIAPGRTWLPAINPEMKAQALTVPRFRKERPPHHALVATNGDVLRGEIAATTATHFGFLAGLEKLRIPRSRVNAAIWLRPPRKDAAAVIETPAIEALLDRPFTRNTRYTGATLSTLLSVFTRELPGLKFNNHVKNSARRSVAMAFSGQTIREALDQLCELFEMRYRVEEDGSITLETGPESALKFIEKSYWLKGDAFPDADSAQARLTEKGIEFPAGASAQWEPAARQLVVKHTGETQAKIEEFLRKEFGANYAALTHWVLLTNGARLGLAVEKFDADFIHGHHPEYGRCRVPMPLVYTIQTGKPAATGAMRSLANWHLMAAREPVIPASGGESSPTLGKDAENFKIPLLTGGDFELKTERGKIVVLDFWATWCGPCIKSIPGLIEAISAFPADRVKLIGVNQGEPADAVKRFVETHSWRFTVAMDADQKVAQKYGVTGIPHTVIVGPDGKIAWVKTGYSPEGPAEAAQAIKTLLGAPPGEAPEARAD